MSRSVANSHEPSAGRPRRVALLVETAIVSGREILKGIGRFLQEGHPWTVFHEPRNLMDATPGWLREWSGDGIIARVSSPEMVRLLRAKKVPVVDVLGLVNPSPYPLVHVDDGAIARLAVEHLTAQRPTGLGYYGFAGENWSDKRQEAFMREARAQGFEPRVLALKREERFSGAAQRALVAWLRSLGRRAGVMACNDELGSDVIQACREAGISVPGELAVMGVDDDEALCSLAQPPLSSIRVGHAQVGYEAASLLQRLMRRGARRAVTLGSEPVWISPAGVMARQSTDLMKVPDLALQRALKVIETEALRGVDVDRVAALSGLSRSVLQRRFRAHLGSTVHDAIQSRKMEEACRLLRETDLPMERVAERCGFEHAEYFGTVFRRRMECTPRGYRLATRRASGAKV